MSGVTAKTYIAVVDDDESLCRSMARLLRASGYHPVTYLSAEAFLNDTNRPDFDCLILDIQLGGMSGIELNEQLANTGVNTPVIFLSAHENADALEQTLSGRITSFLHKSDPAELVLAAIDKVIHADIKHAKTP